MVIETLKYNNVRIFLQELLTQDKYKKITPPESLMDDYHMEGKVAFFLGLDAIIKYDQIIEDDKYLTMYIEQLRRIFKKITNGNDIRLGIYSVLGKAVSMKLMIDSDDNEKILKYIYNKYIINGYFYCGYSSNYTNEINCIGLRKDSFRFDTKLKESNEIIRKISNEPLFYGDDVYVTDDIAVALYYAFLSPNYISCLLDNSLVKKNKNDFECLYTKDITKIKELLANSLKEITLSGPNKIEIINNFIDVYMENNNYHPCIAQISRKVFQKDSLKDIDSIIINKEDDLPSLIALIFENRYNNIIVDKDISSEDINTIELPTYNEFLIGKNDFLILPSQVTISKEALKEKETSVNDGISVNSYGAVSFAIIGVLFIIIGILLSIIIKMNG